jgi:transaldolase / glucose-6-phosphate isomerase
LSATQANERLAALTNAGTAVWLDQIRRSLIDSGELERLVREDSLRGVTSNPAIFEAAILGSEDYDEQIERLAGEGHGPREIYQAIAIEDVQGAADVLRPVYDETGGADGFVSFEVDPDLAFDCDRTLEQAREYWSRVDRPNLMIKIPGTAEGFPAIEQAIAEGINVNVTLLFGVENYSEVAWAYIRGLERRHGEGGSLGVASVASFFVSRVDSMVDKRLDELGRPDLKGRAAIANARAAYRRFEEIFGSDRFRELQAAGARVQRPLWASTGVKNPDYAETKYVDGLVGPDTVNTMPMATLLAAEEHAEIAGATATEDPAADLDALREAGIDLEEVTATLLTQGVDAFVTPMEKLLAGIDAKREAIVTGRPATIDASLPAELERTVADMVRRAGEEDVARRIWKHDGTLWAPPGTPEVEDRLGWLTAHETLRDAIDDLEDFAQQAADDGLTDAVLLGMGGSSLAPEVLRQSFGTHEGRLRLHVLDSTDPAAVLSVEESVDLDKTLFVVSSKSGGTIETLSQFRYFWAKVGEGSQFVAVTDPGSGLEEIAKEHGFRRTFTNDPDIGGRYSALSFFGMAPAALMGADLDALADGAETAAEVCNCYDSSRRNSGLWLGAALGALASHPDTPRDKLTLIVNERLASFGLWAEQLVAESTGKEGKGILPIADEPVGEPEEYGEDRVFVYLRDAGAEDEELDGKVRALADAGHPTITLAANGPADLGRIFFFAEFATAVAGWALGINPFDQPNVQEAKDNTKRVLEGVEGGDPLPDLPDADDAALRELLAGAAPPAYVAIMGYVAPSDELDAAVAELREAIRGATRAATTFGYGPRFLHSTGQLHKGGPASGRFLQLLHDPGDDVVIPEAGYTFGTLKNAQAVGDLQTLREHELPAERVHLDRDDPAGGVRRLTAMIREGQ